MSRPGICGRSQGNGVAVNGTVLEQSQILTTHNLAPLIEALDLGEQVRRLAPELARRVLGWVVRRQAQPCPDHHAALHVRRLLQGFTVSVDLASS